MKSRLVKRVVEAEQRAKDWPKKNLRKLCEKMTTAELKECLDGNTTDERFWAIFEGAAQR